MLSFNIWKLKCGDEEFPIYFTRCFPNKEKFITDFGTLSKNNDYLRYYWLIAYIETICMIEGIDLQSVNNYSFKFLLHDSDVGKTNLLGCFNLSNIFTSIEYFDSVAPHFKLIRKRQTDMVYYYQHTNSSYFYRDIIKNNDFFKDCKNPCQKLDSYLNPKSLNDKFLSLINLEV